MNEDRNVGWREDHSQMTIGSKVGCRAGEGLIDTERQGHGGTY